MIVDKQTWQFLKFAPFSKLESWGYAALFPDVKPQPAFPLVALDNLVAHRKQFIRIEDSKVYRRCRVQLRAQGIVLRDEVIGSVIKTKRQQVCKEGDLLVAEIDAKMGGFGIVPSELAGAVVSGHYFLFEVDEQQLDLKYLALCLKTPFFQSQVQSTGSTNYAAIRPHHVLGYAIPLPSLDEQRRLIADYQTAAKRMREAQRMLDEARQNFESALFVAN